MVGSGGEWWGVVGSGGAVVGAGLGCEKANMSASSLTLSLKRCRGVRGKLIAVVHF